MRIAFSKPFPATLENKKASVKRLLLGRERIFLSASFAFVASDVFHI